MLKNNCLRALEVVVSAVSLGVGALLHLFDHSLAANWLWQIASLLVLTSVLVETVAALWHKNFGLDIIASMAIIGALVLQEMLTAAVIALMYASGRALEGYAENRAQNEMAALLSKAPRFANRYENGSIVQVALATVQEGDRIIVRPGETIPVDGTLLTGATVDESSLTGEALPVSYIAGTALGSGIINAGNAFDMLATATEENSTFTNILRLVRSARESKAPSSRLADQYALLFVPLALGIAGVAWLLTGDPIRALAVIVVATPCPLILAVPVAIVSAISRCAQHGVLIKTGGALEAMARTSAIYFDKTGTLTSGKARLVAVATAPPAQAAHILMLAASLTQLSGHAIAKAVVEAATERGLHLRYPCDVSEVPGAGMTGSVDGRAIRVGSYDYVSGTATTPAWAASILERSGYDGSSVVCIAVDNIFCGVLQLADQIRLDAPRALRMLRAHGIKQIAMLTGDHRQVAETIARSLGIDTVMPEQTPASKLVAITSARGDGVTMMVGDGINDAPAMAAADIGVAMGSRGSAAAAESAHVVLLVDRLDRIAFAIRIARQTRTIALQSVLGGMALSVMAMIAAALGFLPPVAGAVLQELIDVAVIINALRVLRLDNPKSERRITLNDVSKLKEEHALLLPIIDHLGRLADSVENMSTASLKDELDAINAALRNHLLPHERHDDATLYPSLARLLGGEDPMASLSSTHREIFRLCRVMERLGVATSRMEGENASRLELRRTLYALDAILRLHFSQEEELYYGLS